MKMLRWMYSYNRKDKVRNVVIHKKEGVTPVKDKMGETQVRDYLA